MADARNLSRPSDAFLLCVSIRRRRDYYPLFDERFNRNEKKKRDETAEFSLNKINRTMRWRRSILNTQHTVFRIVFFGTRHLNCVLNI